MDKNKKFGLMAALIYFVIFAAYNLVVFLVFKGFNKIFWISYAFMVLAYVIHIVIAISVGKNRSVRAVFFGIPLFSFSIFFVGAELFASLVFMIFRNMASVKVTVLIQALLLCVFIVIAIIALMTRTMVSDSSQKIKDQVGNIKGLTVDVEMLIQRCTDPETMGSLKKLAETIKYSDPMSNSAVETQDQMIKQYMIELRTAFDSGNMPGVRELCDRINLLFIERNKKLMATK